MHPWRNMWMWGPAPVDHKAGVLAKFGEWLKPTLNRRGDNSQGYCCDNVSEVRHRMFESCT